MIYLQYLLVLVNYTLYQINIFGETSVLMYPVNHIKHKMADKCLLNMDLVDAFGRLDIFLKLYENLLF